MSKTFFLILVFFCGLNVTAQTVRLSSFGLEDHTEAFRRAMTSSHDTILIDSLDAPWQLGPLRFYRVHNKALLFEPGAVIKAIPGAFPKTTDALFKFIDCSNIKLIGQGNTIAMNKAEYTDGEWRHVIRLRGCKDVVIKNLTLRDSGGDGITIGRSNSVMFTENVLLENIKSLNNKRQGISIVSAKNVRVLNSVFSQTEGTLPGAGVDIEPDLETERISEIVFENCTFSENFHAGVKLALGKLTSSSEAVDVKFKDCILRNNFSPENTKPPAEIFIRSNKLDPVKGSVVFENCIVEDSKWGLLYAQKNAAGFKVSFVETTARNICQNGPRPAIFLEVPHYRKPADVGGYEFNELFLDYDVQWPVITVRGSRLGTLKHLRDIQGKIVVKKGAGPDFKLIHYNDSNNVEVNLEVVRSGKK